MNYLFKGNATTIGEWATASHVGRQGTRKAKPTAATATKPVIRKHSRNETGMTLRLLASLLEIRQVAVGAAIVAL